MSTYEQPVIDAVALRERVQEMYREVAEQPGGDFHFETGRAVAERLGYPAAWLDAVAPDALASFAGVGHMLDLAAIKPGETVLDLGSGSGTDAFIAALLTGPQGSVVGVDMTTRSWPRHGACVTIAASSTSRSWRGSSRNRRWRPAASTS
jgi:SAM-dependent methyltransferase